MWRPNKVETTYQLCSSEGWGEPMLLQHNNARPHTSTATSGERDHQISSCSTPFLQLRFGTVWFMVICSTYETSQRNSFHTRCRRTSCYGKMVSRRAWWVLQRQVWKTCSLLAAWYWMRGRLCGKIRYRNKAHILSYILCSVSFQYFVWQ